MAKRCRSIGCDAKSTQGISRANRNDTVFNIEAASHEIRTKIVECHEALATMMMITIPVFDIPQFIDAFIKIFNSGNVQYLSLSEIVQFLDERFKNNHKAVYAFLYSKKKHINPAMEYQFSLLAFYYLTAAWDLDCVQSTSIPAKEKKRILSLLSYLFLHKQESFSPALQVIKPGSCPIEMQVRKRIARYAMQWLTIGVDCHSSSGEYAHTRTRLIVDLHNHPDLTAEITIPRKNVAHPWFNTPNVLQMLRENGLKVGEYKLIGYPAYTCNGQRATVVTCAGDTAEMINNRMISGAFLQLGKDEESMNRLRIFEELCSTGQVKLKDTKSFRTAYRVKNLIMKATAHSDAARVAIESEHGRLWKLVDPATGKITTVPYLLLFPIERK